MYFPELAIIYLHSLPRSKTGSHWMKSVSVGSGKIKELLLDLMFVKSKKSGQVLWLPNRHLNWMVSFLNFWLIFLAWISPFASSVTQEEGERKIREKLSSDNKICNEVQLSQYELLQMRGKLIWFYALGYGYRNETLPQEMRIQAVGFNVFEGN